MQGRQREHTVCIHYCIINWTVFRRRHWKKVQQAALGHSIRGTVIFVLVFSAIVAVRDGRLPDDVKLLADIAHLRRYRHLGDRHGHLCLCYRNRNFWRLPSQIVAVDAQRFCQGTTIEDSTSTTSLQNDAMTSLKPQRLID